MMIVHRALATLPLLASCLLIDSASGLTLSLDLVPADFTHTRQYGTVDHIGFFAENLSLEAPAGVINPGDPIDVRLNVLEPIQLENFYTGVPFSLTLQLVKGFPSPTINQTFSSNLDFTGLVNLNAGTRFPFAWVGSTGEVTQRIGTGLTPSGAIGQLSQINWTYTAPDWTPIGSEVRFLFRLSYGGRGDLSTFLDPGRDLITFVPEPCSVLTVAVLCPILVIQLRAARTGTPAIAR